MRLPFRLVYSNDYYLPIGAHVFPAQKYRIDRKSTRLNSSHLVISYAVFCLKKKERARGGPALERPALLTPGRSVACVGPGGQRPPRATRSAWSLSRARVACPPLPILSPGSG